VTVLPIEFSLTELAALTGLTREQVKYRAEHGGIPTVRVNPGCRRSKRVVPLAMLQNAAPELWEALLMRCQLAAQLDAAAE